MMLLTQEIKTKAIKQYGEGSSFDQQVVAKFFDRAGSWTWYLMNMEDEQGDYCWGIVEGFAIEAGSFSLTEMMEVLGPRLERDKFWTPKPAREVWEALNAGHHP